MLNLVSYSAPNQIPYYHIQAFEAYPNLTHAIFTRVGGVSQPPFASLNLGSTVGDEAAAVQENQRRLCQTLNIAPQQTVTCYMVHGSEILTIDTHNHQPLMGQADGLVCQTPNIFLLMRFADCTPLLFFDPVQQIVALAHAGWRGTMQHIAAKTINKMKALGATPHDIIAVIGPSIGPCCYEVGPEVIETAQQQLPQPERLLRHNGQPQHAHFDLWAANRQQLEAAGVQQIFQAELCTACHTEQFFSHRAEKGRTGRFGIVIGLRSTVE